MASLTLLRGEEEGEAFALESPETVIGREEGCAIRIEGLGLSRRHCVIAHANDRYLLRDLSSENGTWVNGLRITEQELRDGDQVGLGVQASLRFRNDAQVAATVPGATPLPQPAGSLQPGLEPSVASDADEEPTNSRAARWLMIVALVGLAILIGMLIEFSMRS
jgi:pSer/pThr/pTyr-binding forkhead associated (FHA) protein